MTKTAPKPKKPTKPPMTDAHKRLFLLGRVDEYGRPTSKAKATPSRKPRRANAETKRERDISVWKRALKNSAAPEADSNEATSQSQSISRERAVAAYKRGHKAP